MKNFRLKNNLLASYMYAVSIHMHACTSHTRRMKPDISFTLKAHLHIAKSNEMQACLG